MSDAQVKKPEGVVLTKEEYDELMRKVAAGDLAQAELRSQPGGIVLNARPCDIETEAKMVCEKNGKHYPATTIDPKTGRETKTEQIAEHAKFVKNEAERRARAAALAASLGS